MKYLFFMKFFKKVIFIAIALIATIQFTPKVSKAQNTLKWGLVGNVNDFVIDETEIVVAEWLEFLYYQSYGKLPSYMRNNSLKEKHLSDSERAYLLHLQPDSALFPIKEFFSLYPASYIFKYDTNRVLYSTPGLFGYILLPVNLDSLSNKEAKKRIDNFLNTPISGISYS